MVRIGIEASERIGLACEAEAVPGPAVMSVPPQCRQRPLNAGQILAATVRYWPTGLSRTLASPIDSSRPRLCENYRRPDQSDGTRQKIPLWFDSVHFSWVSFIRIKNRRINSTFLHTLDPEPSSANGCFAACIMIYRT